MTLYRCDRCGRECKWAELHKINLEMFDTVAELCPECWKELTKLLKSFWKSKP